MSRWLLTVRISQYGTNRLNSTRALNGKHTRTLVTIDSEARESVAVESKIPERTSYLFCRRRVQMAKVSNLNEHDTRLRVSLAPNSNNSNTHSVRVNATRKIQAGKWAPRLGAGYRGSGAKT